MKVKMVKPEKKICPQKEREREVECASEESDGGEEKGRRDTRAEIRER